MIPNDTDPLIYKVYYEMIMSKSPEERFKMGLEMADDGWKLMIAGIKDLYPGIDEKHINIEILKRLRISDPGLSWLESVLK